MMTLRPRCRTAFRCRSYISPKLINALGIRLREAHDRIAELTRTHPQKLRKFFDEFT
jgi:hypothetical protein